jgi:tRNA A-37 threonylcarbamoyl transferase component Bud32
MRDLVGRVIAGKYEVTQRIGGGGVADVYEAVHQRLNQRVAIKVLRKEFSRFPAITHRFLTEGRAASAVKHPGIVQVFDVDQLDTGELYIVMELLQGDELSVALERDQQLEPERAVDIALQILDALDAAHGAGVVHRDLKPENVLLLLDAGGNEKVKIIDFGVARLEREGPAALRKTAEGTIVGTPYYVSPEQARGEQNLDHRTDIYAVGILLYEMLTGELPYTGTSVQAIIKKVLEDPFPRVRATDPSVPEALEAAILKATSRRREDRQASAAEFGRELRAAVGREPAPEPLPTVTAARSLDEAAGGELPAEPLPGETATVGPARRPAPPPPRRAPSQQTAEGLDVPRVHTVVVLPARLWLFVLGGAVVAAGIVAVLFLYAFRRQQPADTSPALAVAATADAGTAAPSEAASPPSLADATVAPPPAPDAGSATTSVKELDAADLAPPAPDAGPGPTARVRLLRLPRGATVTLDDAPVEEEFTAPIADTPRRLRIEAPGWKTWVRTIRVAADVELAVAMERRGSTPPPPADAGGLATTDTFRPLANPFGTPAPP